MELRGHDDQLALAQPPFAAAAVISPGARAFLESKWCCDGRSLRIVLFPARIVGRIDAGDRAKDRPPTEALAKNERAGAKAGPDLSFRRSSDLRRLVACYFHADANFSHARC